MVSPQVKAPAQAQGFLRSAFPLSCPRMLLKSCGAARPPSTAPCRRTSHLKEPTEDRCPRGMKSGRESAGSDGTCSSPPGSSCYSSQRSSPAGLSVNWYEPAETSLSRLRLEEEEPETDVDTGCAVKPQAALGASALLTLSRDLKHGLDESMKSVQAETQVEEFFIWLVTLIPAGSTHSHECIWQSRLQCIHIESIQGFPGSQTAILSLSWSSTYIINYVVLINYQLI